MTAWPALPRPAVAPPARWSFPTPREWTLDNGLRVLAYHLPGRALAAARLVFDVPLHTEPVDGTVSLLAAMLREGSDTDDAESFAARLNLIGATYAAYAGFHALFVEIEAPAATLGEALRLAASSVRAPNLAEDVVARVRRERIDDIAHSRAQSASRADLEFRALASTAGSRLSRPVRGSAEDVATLDPAALRDGHTAHVHPDRATLVLAGDLSGLDPESLVAHAFADWTAEPERAREHQAPRPGEPRVVIVDRPGAVQSSVRLGLLVGNQHSADWTPLRLANHALGGRKSARLGLVLREEKGYTYGIRSHLQPQRLGGLLTVACSVATDVTGPALADIHAIIRSTVDNGITEAELAHARDYFLGVGPIGYQTSAAIANQSASLVEKRLPIDFVDRQRDAVVAVTTTTASQALRAHLDLGRLSVVVVGDATVIADQVRDSWPATAYETR